LQVTINQQQQQNRYVLVFCLMSNGKLLNSFVQISEQNCSLFWINCCYIYFFLFAAGAADAFGAAAGAAFAAGAAGAAAFGWVLVSFLFAICEEKEEGHMVCMMNNTSIIF
jgi:hypothetical protein